MTDLIQQLAEAQTTILTRAVVIRTLQLIVLAQTTALVMLTDLVTTPGTLEALACGPTKGLCLKTATRAEPTLAAIPCAELFLDAPAPIIC